MKRPDKYYQTFTKKDLIEYIDYVEDFVINMAAIKHKEINELKKQVNNLNLADVMITLLKEQQLEPIENILHSEGNFLPSKCNELAEIILQSIDDYGYDIININES